MSQPRILIIGEAVAPTGFARVIREIFTPLRARYDLHQLATRCDADASGDAWPLYPAVAGDGDRYGYRRLPELIGELDPDIVFLLYDLSFQAQYMSILRAAKAAKIVIYSPVESGPIAPELIGQIAGVARYVAFTNYGRAEIEAALDQLRASGNEVEFPAIDVIPHGVDSDAFQPLQGDDRGATRTQSREAMGILEPGRADDFIVLNANRNMPRKRIDLTIEGFARFAADKPIGVQLYLHMATEDTGWNVLLLARRHGIEDRLIMTRADNVKPTLSDQELNLLYNACDVGLTTTTGEAWGMVAFEHAATGAAQIMPRHTGLKDLWDGSAAFIEPYTRLTYPGNLTDGHMVSAEGVAAALERVYRDDAYRASLVRAGLKIVAKPEYRWSAISIRWDRLFQEMVGAKQPGLAPPPQ